MKGSGVQAVTTMKFSEALHRCEDTIVLKYTVAGCYTAAQTVVLQTCNTIPCKLGEWCKSQAY